MNASRVGRLVGYLLASAAVVGFAASVSANQLPPPGPILDLAGGLSPHNAPKQYSVNFLASDVTTAITFAFRNDPMATEFSNVSLVDLADPSKNLLLNGDFSSYGLSTLLPSDWTYANPENAAFGGYVTTTCVGAKVCWYDGATQGYDSLSQSVATTAGDIYQISFWAVDDSGLSHWSNLSTNGDVTDPGGNGANILAYAFPNGSGGPPPPPGPELSTWGMMLLGFVGLGYVGYGRGARRAIG